MNAHRRYERGQWIAHAIIMIRRWVWAWIAAGWMVLIPWALIVIGSK